MADLSSYKLSDTSALRVRLPDGKPSDIEIELYNQHSRHYQKVVADTMREAAATDVKAEDHVAAILAKCTVGWKGIVWEGKTLKFSQEEALKLYSNPGLKWLSDQVDRFVHHSANFLGKQKTS